MKSLISFFIKNFHWILILNTALTVFLDSENHERELADLKIKIPELKLKIENLKNKIKLNETYKANLESSKKRVEEVALLIEETQKQLPNKIENAEVLNQFSDEAKMLNIKDVFLQPGVEESKGFYFSKKFQMKAVGTYLQFLVFFERLSNNQRLFNISNLQLKNAKENQKGRFKLLNIDVTLEAFRYNSEFKEDRGILEIENKFKNENANPNDHQKNAHKNKKSKKVKKKIKEKDLDE